MVYKPVTNQEMDYNYKSYIYIYGKWIIKMGCFDGL